MQSASESKAALSLIMGNTFGPVQLGQPTLDVVREDEPLYRVIHRGVCRHGLQHFDNTSSAEWRLHDYIVMQLIDKSGAPPQQPSKSDHSQPSVQKFDN